ncbi:hypothetical protein GCM10009868_07230 [Terrabacter aerolatus]|uniref:PknH-like extracellular domain-containing protein n=1 Tax=Terrabacter aerolatus TaxID=422442 RepID=A0A512D6F1_9MICO|nr:hypothetical protein TAE01_38630 [Terrabacter aerolatus]
MLPAVAAAVWVLGACTAAGTDPVVGGATAAAPASVSAGTTASAVPGPDPATTQPDPGMTPIEAAPQCTTTRPLTGKGRVPLDAVFPGAETSAFSAPKEVVPGPDAADPARCPGGLPSRPHCDGLVPWTDQLADAFVPASRARRLVEGYLLTMPKQAGNQAPPESSAGTKAVTYSLVDLAAGDPGGLVDYVRAAFASCAKAVPSRVDGVDALVGTVRSEYGAGSAEVVLLRRGSHLVWASLDGSGWEQGEEQRALVVLVARLL